ncbi:MAG: hypothetical protein R3A11_09510 [Bdellovibrionota bacterium]
MWGPVRGIWAQDDDFFSPPPVSSDPPPWVSGDSGSSGGDQAAPSTSGADDAPAVPFFPGMDDEEDFAPSYSSGSSSRSSSSAAPKDSFKWAGEEEGEEKCIGWGNPLLGTQLFDSQTQCEAEVSSQIDKFKKTIRFVEENFENYKLKHQIKKNISREEAKTYHLDFVESEKVFGQSHGCICLG